jgi:ketosteroid isomerase-like protein
MKAAACLFVTALAVAAPLVGEARAHPPSTLSAAQEKATADEIVAFRKAMADATAAKDAAKLRRMYAEGFVHTHTSGKLDGRDPRIVALLAGDPVIELAPVDDLVIRIPGGWTAIATGQSPIKSMADGKTYAVRWTAAYVRGPDGEWQLAASHATRVGEIKP